MLLSFRYVLLRMSGPKPTQRVPSIFGLSTTQGEQNNQEPKEGRMIEYKFQLFLLQTSSGKWLCQENWTSQPRNWANTESGDTGMNERCHVWVIDAFHSGNSRKWHTGTVSFVIWSKLPDMWILYHHPCRACRWSLAIPWGGTPEHLVTLWQNPKLKPFARKMKYFWMKSKRFDPPLFPLPKRRNITWS